MGYSLSQIHSANSNSPQQIQVQWWQIQIRHGKFKFTVSNSNSLRQFQILHGQIKIHNGKFPGGGGLPYEEYTGVCHELGSYFQEQIPKRVCNFSKKFRKGYVIFQKNSGKGYNICKKFQIGSVILMTQMTNQKKTELIDFFDIVWTKNPQFLENFWKWKPFFSQNSPQNRA